MIKNLIFFLPNFSEGGAGKSILKMCKSLNKKKYNIYIISLTKNFYKKELSKYCKNIFEINVSKTIFSFGYIKMILIKNNLRKNNTVFISNINYSNVLSLFFLKWLNSYKVVVTERTPFQELDYTYSFVDFIKKRIIKFLIYVLYNKADLIICNAKKIAQDFKNYTKANAIFIYPQTINKVRKNYKKKLNKKINILSIDRFSKEKNFNDILNSINLLDKDIKNQTNLVLVGRGPEKDELQKMSRKFKIKTKFIFYNENNIHKIFKYSHIYINSSHFEGFPNAVVDAINNNLPIISSKSHGGINEILLNGRGGTFYNQNNYSELSQKILWVKSNYKKCQRKNKLAKKYISRFTNINNQKFEKNIDKLFK